MLGAVDWKWSSFRHYATGEDCGVQIERWKSRVNSLPIP